MSFIISPIYNGGTCGICGRVCDLYKGNKTDPNRYLRSHKCNYRWFSHSVTLPHQRFLPLELDNSSLQAAITQLQNHLTDIKLQHNNGFATICFSYIEKLEDCIKIYRKLLDEWSPKPLRPTKKELFVLFNDIQTLTKCRYGGVCVDMVSLNIRQPLKTIEASVFADIFKDGKTSTGIIWEIIIRWDDPRIYNLFLMWENLYKRYSNLQTFQ